MGGAKKEKREKCEGKILAHLGFAASIAPRYDFKGS
jgi:hypothetical protein